MAEPQIDVTTDRAVETCRRQLPTRVGGGDVVFGFDGMIDYVREMVDTRRGPDSYVPVRTLDSLAARFRGSADENSSIAIDWVRKGTRLGGHTSHLARFFGGIGYDPAMVGTFGTPIRGEFREEFGAYEMVSLGEPGETQAVEFDDGKCMLSESGSYLRFDWDSLLEAISLAELAERVDGTRLFGVGYWTVIPRLPSILAGLREDLWPTLSNPPSRVLVDPGDIRHLEVERLRSGFEALERLGDVADLTLSANRVETLALANAVDGDDPDRSFVAAATAVHDRLDAARVVGHNVDFSVSVSDARTARVAVPRVDDPEITTSAGDHFNAGFALGLLEGLDDAAALALGNAVAHRFVRTGSPPSFEEIGETVDAYGDRFSA